MCYGGFVESSVFGNVPRNVSVLQEQLKGRVGLAKRRRLLNTKPTAQAFPFVGEVCQLCRHLLVKKLDRDCFCYLQKENCSSFSVSSQQSRQFVCVFCGSLSLLMSSATVRPISRLLISNVSCLVFYWVLFGVPGQFCVGLECGFCQLPLHLLKLFVLLNPLCIWVLLLPCTWQF